jgi:hypothetical protein
MTIVISVASTRKSSVRPGGKSNATGRILITPSSSMYDGGRTPPSCSASGTTTVAVVRPVSAARVLRLARMLTMIAVALATATPGTSIKGPTKLDSRPMAKLLAGRVHTKYRGATFPVLAIQAVYDTRNTRLSASSTSHTPLPDAQRQHEGDREQPPEERERRRADARSPVAVLGLLQLLLGLRRQLAHGLEQDAHQCADRALVVRIERERRREGPQRLAPQRLRVGPAARRQRERHLRVERVPLRDLLATLGVALSVEVRLERVVQLPRAGVTVGRLGGRGPDADGLELRRHVAVRRALARARVRAGERGAEERVQAGAWVQGLERQRLEQDGAERVHVGPRVDALHLAARLLRRHVPGRPEQRARLRSGRGRRVGHVEGHIGRARDARDAPIEDVHLAELPEHDVGRLQIPVHHAAGVREGDREAHAGERPEEPAPAVGRRERRIAIAEAVEDVLEGHAVEPLHREVRLPALVDPEVVYGHDARVLELALHPRLPQEAHPQVGA